MSLAEQDAHHWQQEAVRWEGIASDLETEIDQLRRRNRNYRNQAHTRRLLYNELLTKIAARLDIHNERTTP